MKKNIGIWIDSNQAVIITLSNNTHSLKKIESNIVFRERVEGETKKYGRFGGQYLTYEKNRENRRNELTNLFFKKLVKEISNCNAIVLFGPSTMKNQFEKEIKKNMQIADKLVGTYNSDSITENQMVAWVKDCFNK
jgi:stalled ribosome rescue protein Dom34